MPENCNISKNHLHSPNPHYIKTLIVKLNETLGLITIHCAWDFFFKSGKWTDRRKNRAPGPCKSGPLSQAPSTRKQQNVFLNGVTFGMTTLPEAPSGGKDGSIVSKLGIMFFSLAIAIGRLNPPLNAVAVMNGKRGEIKPYLT